MLSLLTTIAFTFSSEIKVEIKLVQRSRRARVLFTDQVTQDPRYMAPLTGGSVRLHALFNQHHVHELGEVDIVPSAVAGHVALGHQ